jgi:cell wall-associated NlpC family hydrolase
LLLRTARRLLRALALSAVVASFIVPATSAAANPTPKSIQQQITAAQTEFDKLVDQYDGVNQQLTDNEAAEATLAKQIAPALAASQEAQAKVGKFAAQAYMAGPVRTLSVLVSAESTSQMLDTMGALNEVAVSQNQRIAAYRQAITAYTSEKQKLDGLISIETAQRASLAKQKATIKTKLAKLYVLRTQAYGSATSKPTSTGQPAPYIPGRGGKVVKYAYAQLGKPYVWAADGPGSFDCSGLVLAAYRAVGVSLPHNTTMQWHAMSHISGSQLSPGDVVFYEASSIHHVAIYIGGGKVIHAPTPGDHVKISSVGMMSIYGYGRP